MNNMDIPKAQIVGGITWGEKKEEKVRIVEIEKKDDGCLVADVWINAIVSPVFS